MQLLGTSLHGNAQIDGQRFQIAPAAAWHQDAVGALGILQPAANHVGGHQRGHGDAQRLDLPVELRLHVLQGPA